MTTTSPPRPAGRQQEAPGLAEEFNEDMREAGEWVWWGCFDPFVFSLVMAIEAIRRRMSRS